MSKKLLLINFINNYLNFVFKNAKNYVDIIYIVVKNLNIKYKKFNHLNVFKSAVYSLLFYVVVFCYLINY